MINDALEFLAKKWGNVVLYDSDGNPSYYVPFNKCMSSELDSNLPAHVHPAFIVGDKILDRVLIGKYKASGGTVLYSIPGKDPANNLSYDTFLTRLKNFKSGASGITIADHGLILLTAKKMGWQPKGNNNYGADYQDGTRWQSGQSIAVNNERVYRGWLYKALIAHTSSDALAPENNPAYWLKEKQVGGAMSAATGAGSRTLTGSGPLDWCLGKDPGNLVDPQGNVLEQVYGFRTYGGELQILPNNDAADPTKDLSASSAEWKAILPGASEADYTLVAPGTAGTLHINWDGSKVVLDTSTDLTAWGSSYRSIAFSSLTASANISHIPCIVRELGLFPCTGDNVTKGTMLFDANGERVPRRSGPSYSSSSAGLGFLYCLYDRSVADAYYGARGRFLES